MNEKLFKKEMDNEDSSIASRRKFLKQIAYGSLLTMGGSGDALAGGGVVHSGCCGGGLRTIRVPQRGSDFHADWRKL